MLDRIDATGEGWVEGLLRLEARWAARLLWDFDHFNYQYAGSRLRRPQLRIGDSAEKLGEWDGRLRILTIHRRHILTHSWEEVLETLRHEMAHQYVQEILGLRDAPPHGEAFARACRVMRAEAACSVAAGRARRIEDSDDEKDRMLRRVKELFALATSPNEHEAASAMRMANRYLLKYNLSLQDVRRPGEHALRHLGRVTGRVQEHEYGLATILERHFFVEVMWVYSYDPRRDVGGKILQIGGTPENLDIAEYVHHYVLRVGEELWAARRRLTPDLPGTRRQYLAGLVRGFRLKLGEEAAVQASEHGLVWSGDPILKEFWARLHPRVVRTGLSGVRRGEGFAAGLTDGKRLTLRKPLGESKSRGRLLE